MPMVRPDRDARGIPPDARVHTGPSPAARNAAGGWRPPRRAEDRVDDAAARIRGRSKCNVDAVSIMAWIVLLLRCLLPLVSFLFISPLPPLRARSLFWLGDERLGNGVGCAVGGAGGAGLRELLLRRAG
jgi:hypothetical protein